MGRLQTSLTIAVILLVGCGEPGPTGESTDPIRGAVGRYVPRGSVEGSHHHVDCMFHVRIKGKLTDAETGSGCAGAWILTIPERSWADDAEFVEQYRQMNAERDAERAPYAQRNEPWPSNLALFGAAAKTTADGTFDVVVDVPWSVAFVGDERTSPTRPPSRHGVEALYVEAEGEDPLVIDIPENCGDWTEHPDDPDESHDLWATWDLGTVRPTSSD